MKQLLLLSGSVAAALCLGVLASHADVAPTTRPQPLPQSRPAGDGLLAQFSTLCRKNCEQTWAACHNKNANDPSCSANYNTCIQGCN
jgi:hypothetical protein